MTKVIYNGNLQSCRIKVGTNIINRWVKGESMDIPESEVERLLRNTDFILENESDKIMKPEVVEEVEEPVEELVEETVEEVDDVVELEDEEPVEEVEEELVEETLEEEIPEEEKVEL